MFWGALGAGALISASGFLLLFPFCLTNIAGMQIAQVVHSVIAMLFVALIFGKIYIGTLRIESAFEAMWTGEVDLNWAKEHHDLWLEDALAKGRRAPPPQLPSATPAKSMEQRRPATFVRGLLSSISISVRLVARLQRGRKDVVRLRGGGKMIAPPFAEASSDPLRHGVSDNAGLKCWVGHEAIYVKGSGPI